MTSKLSALALTLVTAGLFLGAPAVAHTPLGSTGTTHSDASNPTAKLAAQYRSLAGSPDNAQSLIIGLREGQSITLSGASAAEPAATFTPATGKLGYGNINIALSLAKFELAKQGISQPTPAQLAAALNGGTLVGTNGEVTMAGILAQRQAGLGWGQIANAMGVKLGAVVSASKTDKAGKKPARRSATRGSGKVTTHGQYPKSKANHGGNQGGNSAGHGGGGGGGGKK